LEASRGMTAFFFNAEETDLVMFMTNTVQSGRQTLMHDVRPAMLRRSTRRCAVSHSSFGAIALKAEGHRVAS
jgi:hypothetical protein